MDGAHLTDEVLVFEGLDYVAIEAAGGWRHLVFRKVGRVVLRGVETDSIEFLDVDEVDWVGGVCGDPKRARSRIRLIGVPHGRILDVGGFWEIRRLDGDREVRTCTTTPKFVW